MRKIDRRLEDIQISMAEVRMIYESQARRLERLEHEVFGNGRAGLSTQVRAVLWIASGCLAFLALLTANVVTAWLS
jgi:hypothetical protein